VTGATLAAVVPVSLLLGLATGAVLHRSDICVAGMFRDLFLLRRADMLRFLVLLVVASMALFEAARLLGLLRPFPFPLLYAPTSANVVGGLLIGAGMVLAGGCVLGTLVRLGAGSFASLVAFAGIVAGSGLYAEFHPAWKAFAGATTFWKDGITLPQALGVGQTGPVLIVAGAGGLLLLRWGRAGLLYRRSPAAGHLQPWKAALALSAFGLLSWTLVGMPLGITSSYTKLAAIVEGLVAPGHLAATAFFSGVPLKSVHPLTGEALVGGPGPGFDALAAIQYPLVLGIVLGSALSARSVGEFHPRLAVPGRQLASAFAGGLLMGLASRMAPTCNVWHLFGGLPILATSSILFLGGLVPGAWIGTRLLARLVVRAP
jgi:uncharacterized membrane protein YedE/YeeE